MKKIKLLSLVLLAVMAASILQAQSKYDTLTRTILEKDRLFWTAYNSCDTVGFGNYVSDDVEFYHDKGGLTYGKAKLVNSITNNLCSNPNFRLRREAIPGTVTVFPLENNGVIYGAIMSGRHYFYINEPGKKEYRDGMARFTHVWQLNNGVWKMTRILSFDHGPAKDI